MEKMILDFDYQIFFMDGMKVNEVVTENADSSFTIFINNNLCDSKKLEAISHAIRHITGRDFEKSDVQSIETSAHV